MLTAPLDKLSSVTNVAGAVRAPPGEWRSIPDLVRADWLGSSELGETERGPDVPEPNGQT